MSLEEENGDILREKMLPPKKRKVVETETEDETEEKTPEKKITVKDSAPKRKFIPSVLRHTSCPNHYIAYMLTSQNESNS